MRGRNGKVRPRRGSRHRCPRATAGGRHTLAPRFEDFSTREEGLEVVQETSEGGEEVRRLTRDADGVCMVIERCGKKHPTLFGEDQATRLHEPWNGKILRVTRPITASELKAQSHPRGLHNQPKFSYQLILPVEAPMATTSRRPSPLISSITTQAAARLVSSVWRSHRAPEESVA